MTELLGHNRLEFPHVAVFRVVFQVFFACLCIPARPEVLITESGFHLLLWKDLIYDKMSVEGLLGGGGGDTGVLVLLGDYFLDGPSCDK